MKIYQFYAELEGYKPKMWRRFQVDADITVARLGYIVMAMYEMAASHLLFIEHERPFLTPSGKKSSRMELISRYGFPYDDIDVYEDEKEAAKSKLSKINLEAPCRLLVWYDMGDDWRVIVTLEEVQETADLPKKEFPKVLEGKGFGIVEDCGGVYALEHLAKAFKTKKGKEYKELKEWLGVDDLDMDSFDIDDINFRIKTLPNIYAKIYEKKRRPTVKEICIIERGYLASEKKGK